MLKNLFIVFFLQICLNGFSQSIVFCESDSLREFKVEPSNESNILQWEFVTGNGAQIIEGQNSDRVLIEFSSPGNFLLQFTEQTSNGCSSSREIEITVNPLPSVSFTTDNMCVNQETRFLNTSNSQSEIVSCMWLLPNYQFETENLNFTFFNIGQFPVSLEMTDENGCFNSLTKMVDIKNPPLADFYFTPSTISTLNPEFEITNMSVEGDYMWDFDGQDYSYNYEPVHYFDSAGWHSITLFVQDESGCIDSLTKEILMEVDMIMYMPNAFTPNSNSTNDRFGPSGFQFEKITSFHMQILNKWGEIIFESYDVENKWDGNTKNGVPAMIDTYTWSVRLSDQLGKKYHEFGFVDLIR
jgi:gliding motility-associated-like protein